MHLQKNKREKSLGVFKDFESSEGKKSCKTNARQDAVGINCVKDPKGKTAIDSDQVKKVWR